MKLRVTYRPTGAPPVNLQITADATATAGDIARVLAKGPSADAALPEEGRLTLQVSDSDGRPSALAPTQPAVNSGLVSGSVVDVRLAPRRAPDRGEPVALLRVVAGPDAGIEVPLPMGASAIGRAPDCDVQLTDPLVSKWHARVEVRDGVEVVDTNSANGVIVGGVRVQRVAVQPRDLVALGDDVVTVEFTRPVDTTSTDIDFIRPPRVLRRRRARKLPLPQPPTEVERARFPWLAMIAPLVMGGVLFAVTQNWMTIAFVALSPLLMIGTWLDQHLEQRRRHKEAAANFARLLEAADAKLAWLHAQEREQLEAAYPSVTTCVRAIGDVGEDLWCRRPEHPEFLQVRLGLGDVAPLVEIENRDAPGRDEFVEPRDRLLEKYDRLWSAPVVADLRAVGGIGVCGREGLAEGVARAIVAQVAALHSPAEVVVCCLTSAVGRGRWLWVEWLPHAASPQSPIGALQLASDAATARLLLDHLEELVASRRPAEGRNQAVPLPAVVVIVDDPSVDLGRLTWLAEAGPGAGVHLLWVAPQRRGIPAACRAFLDVGDGTEAQVGLVHTEEMISPVQCESLDLGTAMRVARRLVPVVDVGAPVHDDSDVPRSVSVVSLIGRDAADDPEQVLTRWRENGSWVDRSGPVSPRERPGDLRAVVGHTGIDPFTLDLRSQGPHALVGGTTGSGKSEFLQAWVLGLAHAYSPDRVTFLFVDYKGGAAFEACTALPHTVGMVTDLSPYLVRRALRSLRAEIHHREVLLQEKGVKDLIDFELTGDPACPPSLVIVVDEFAALAGEVPEFVDGVVDVAQRGRSLGLHLIMATQRPAGVIKDSLRANTNLRVALRMNDDHDSIDVLGDPMAARFDPAIPGRGAARTGPGRLTQFQSAYPGARTYAEPPAPPIEVVELEFGAGRPWKVAASTASGPKPAKDIERVVDSVVAAARLGAVPAPRRPWLDTLAPVYNLELLSQRTDAELVLGVMDDPDRQRQVVAHFRPDEQGNILFLGTSGSGKTSALRTLAIAAGITPRGGPVHVYGLDFAGGGLSMLEALPYVGSIVAGDDEERVTRLVRHLNSLIDERSTRYSAARASDIVDYRRLAGRPDEPRVLVLLDGFGTFQHEYDSTMARTPIYDAFRRVLTDGRGVGVHVAMTTERIMGLPGAVLSAFQKRVVLRQADEDSYVEAGVPRDVLNPASGPGRGLQVDRPEEMQVAILGDDPSPVAQARLIEQMAEEIRPFVKGVPQPVRALPALVPAQDLPGAVRGLPTLGVESESLAPVGFVAGGPLLLTGPRQSGRTNALRWLALSLRRWHPGIELVHLSPRRTSLSGAPWWSLSLSGPGRVEDYLNESLLARVSTEREDDALPSFAVFVEAASEFINSNADQALTDAIVACRRNGHPIVLESEVSEAGGYGSILGEARQARTGMLLQPETNDDSLLQTPLPRCQRVDFPPGRGFWVHGGKAIRVQLPLVSE